MRTLHSTVIFNKQRDPQAHSTFHTPVQLCLFINRSELFRGTIIPSTSPPPRWIRSFGCGSRAGSSPRPGAGRPCASQGLPGFRTRDSRSQRDRALLRQRLPTRNHPSDTLPAKKSAESGHVLWRKVTASISFVGFSEDKAFTDDLVDALQGSKVTPKLWEGIFSCIKFKEQKTPKHTTLK